MATKKASTKSAKSKSTNKTKVVRSASVSSRSAAAQGAVFGLSVGSLMGELVGTFLLAALVIATSGQPIFVLFGLAIIVLTIGTLSGAHVNPAITFGAWVTKKIETRKAVGYIVFQVIGAMLALVVLNGLLGGQPSQANPLTGASQAPEIFKAAQLTKDKEAFAFFANLLGMSIFGFAVASAIREKKEHFAAAFTVGGGLFLGLVIAGATAILNPAVALSLQAFTDLKGEGALTWALGVHVLAPLVGSALGFLLYDLFRRDVEDLA